MTSETFALLAVVAVFGIPALIAVGYLVVALIMLPFEIAKAIREEREERAGYAHRMAVKRAIEQR